MTMTDIDMNIMIVEQNIRKLKFQKQIVLSDLLVAEKQLEHMKSFKEAGGTK